MFGLFRPSGGLAYHWRARRFAKQWNHFTLDLAKWLDNWIPTDELILIGPSAGYTLPQFWLKRFKKIIAVDIDPLAPMLFQLRHPGLPIEFVAQDILRDEREFSFKPFNQFIEEHPQATILFCNILGQLLLEDREARRRGENYWKHLLEHLSSTLKDRHWASYHDVYTLEPLAPQFHTRVAERIANFETLQEALRDVPRNKNLQIIDHLTDFPAWRKGLERRSFAWSLTPNCLHLLEGIRRTKT